MLMGRQHGLAWVCLHHALLASKIYRRLGYPTSILTVAVRYLDGVDTSGEKPQPVVADLGQTAALEVYYHGQWHFVDPWTNTRDLSGLLRSHYYRAKRVWWGKCWYAMRSLVLFDIVLSDDPMAQVRLPAMSNGWSVRWEQNPPSKEELDSEMRRILKEKG